MGLAGLAAPSDDSSAPCSSKGADKVRHRRPGIFTAIGSMTIWDFNGFHGFYWGFFRGYMGICNLH